MYRKSKNETFWAICKHCESADPQKKEGTIKQRKLLHKLVEEQTFFCGGFCNKKTKVFSTYVSSLILTDYSNFLLEGD